MLPSSFPTPTTLNLKQGEGVTDSKWLSCLKEIFHKLDKSQTFILTFWSD